MEKLLRLAGRALYALALFGFGFAIVEGFAGLGGRSLVGDMYSAGRLLDFSAILMVFAIGLQLRELRHRLAGTRHD